MMVCILIKITIVVMAKEKANKKHILRGKTMNIYKQIKQIAELNEHRTELVNELVRNELDVDDLNFNEACLIKDCVEEDGHLYDKDGKKLDNCGLVDNNRYNKFFRQLCK